MNSIQKNQLDSTLHIFFHHIYEFQKGIRDLILLTTFKCYQKHIEELLKKKNIYYQIYPVSMNKINVFFGKPICVQVIKQIKTNNLSHLSPEQDFILGIMLGYDRLKQCERLMKRNQ